MGETTASPGAAAGAAEQPNLRRVMGPGLLLLFVVGDILGTRDLRVDWSGRGPRRRRGVDAVRRCLSGRHHHGFQLPGTGDEVPAGRRSRSLHAQGVRRSFPHIHRRVHGDVLGHHLGVNGVEGVRGEPRRGLQPRFRRRRQDHAGRARVHHPDRDCELPRRRRERQGQCRAHLRRAVRTPIDHLYWSVGAQRWWRRLLTGDAVAGAEGPGPVRRGHRGQGLHSSPWWVSRTR
jgi:hypothetical protein